MGAEHTSNPADIIAEEEAGVKPPPPERHSSAKIAAVVAFYFFISLSLVFINKIIMDGSFFPYPVVITWFQFIVALVCVLVGGHLGKSYSTLAFMPEPEFDLATARKVMPVTVLYICMIAANNLCLKYVEVSFYQVARSLTILFTVLFTYLWLRKTTSLQSLAMCGVIVLGFVLGSKGEINFSYTGVAFGLISSCFVSLYGISVKAVLQTLQNDHWKLLLYNTAISIVFMVPLVWLSGEVTPLMADPNIYDPSVWVANILGGLFGFAINIAVFLQIKFTSPLTNNIAGTVKASLQTILAVIIFQNPVSFMNAMGIVLVIGGSGAYSYIRYLEMNKS